MKFALEWLASYLPGPLPEAAELRERLTTVGFIVEAVEGRGAEAVFEVEVTPNRPDAMSHRGLAREAAVALGRTFRDAPATAPHESGPPAETLARVRIDEPALSSRYSARVVEGIRVVPASAPVAGRLAALGMGPISAPVDATNHVLWDVGQPLHAFDLDKLAKGPSGVPEIVVRRARAGETLVTLDGVLRVLTPEHLVIADAERAVALAGVMGGLDTAISESTTRVLLESAHFEPGVVRRGARSLGMHTDASHRFERGTDPAGTVEGLNRAAALLLADCGGRLAAGAIDVVACAVPPRETFLRWARLTGFLGMDVPRERTLAILSALAFETRVDEGRGGVRVVVPSWRVDVEQEIDLVEEVIRHVGYDALPETLPAPFVPTAVDPLLVREERARDYLAGAGLVEASTYSFVSEEENAPFVSVAPGEPARVENPLAEPFTTMRATPVVGLLKAGQHNVRRGARELALFEVGRSYGRAGREPVEARRATFLLFGRSLVHWSEEGRSVDFFDGSGLVAGLLAALGAPAPSFAPASFPFLSPGRAAEILGPAGARLGWLGVLAAPLAAAWDLPDAVVGDVDLGALAPPRAVTSVEAPARFPGSEVDLTVTHRLEMPWAELEAAARRDAPAALAAVEAKYRYQGAGVPAGFVKTTLTLRFGAADRSLARDEVNAWRDEAARRFRELPDARVDGAA